jgi:hypothetical protein
MGTARSQNVTRSLAFCLALVMAGLLAACSVNVKKDEKGEEKNVDIETPIGGIHVSNDAHANDTGLPVYAGARLKKNDKDDEGNDKNANVNLSAFGFGLKVVAAQYESDDPPAKLVAFYRDQLKKYGPVLECRTSGNVDYSHHSDKAELSCEQNSGNNIELKAGTKDSQHIVAIEPQSKGSNFALVYVQTHGKDTI